MLLHDAKEDILEIRRFELEFPDRRAGLAPTPFDYQRFEKLNAIHEAIIENQHIAQAHPEQKDVIEKRIKTLIERAQK